VQEVDEENDYYKKNAVSRLDPEKAKELQELEKASRPKTKEELI
jgi:hypothetical protein